MYNEEQKMAFIDSKSVKWTRGTTEHVVSIFDGVASIEEEYGVDLCQMKSEQARRVAAQVGVDGAKWVARYVSWCAKQGISGVNEPLIRRASVLEDARYKDKMLSGPTHLQHVLDLFFTPITMKSKDILIRCYFWLAFSGVPREWAPFIKKEHLDFDNMEIHYNGRNFYIHSEAVKTFRLAADLTEFEPVFNGKPTYKSPLPREDGTELLRGEDGDGVDIDKILDRVKGVERRSEHTFRLVYKNVWDSGIFYRAYEYERSPLHGEQNFTAEASLLVELSDEGMSQEAREKKRTRNIRYFKTELERWKLAFAM